MKRLSLVVLAFLIGCAPISLNNHKYSSGINPIEKKVSYKRRVFEEFLSETRDILKGHKLPKVFISYAWESLKTPEGRAENEKLQSRLVILQKDLEFVGMEVFLDIKELQGNYREAMHSGIDRADFVILIGTPRLNMRGNRDRLFMLPYFDSRLIPKEGNVLALVESPDFYAVYYLEEGKLKEIKTMSLKLENILWIDQQNGIKEAYLGKKTNDLLEFLFNRLETREFKSISNIQYEIGISIDKVHKSPKSLIPLIFKGDYYSSFPTIIQNNLIRDISNENNYYIQMSTLTNPLGIIAALCPQLIRDHRYINLVDKFEKSFKRN